MKKFTVLATVLLVASMAAAIPTLAVAQMAKDNPVGGDDPEGGTDTITPPSQSRARR